MVPPLSFRVLALATAALSAGAGVPQPGCSPAGLYYANRDIIRHTDPITVVAAAAPWAGCPGMPMAGYIASTRKYWKNAKVCGYANGSLWKEDGQTAEVGAGCDVVEWSDPSPATGRFLWCGADLPTQRCAPLPPKPSPPAPPKPSPPEPPAPPKPSPFSMYDPVPATGVAFTSTDTSLSALVAHAAAKARQNIKTFRVLPSGRNFSVMEEGGQFHAAWLETQPMAGAMYGTRDARIGLNNQLVFMAAQRADGFLPGQVSAGPALPPRRRPDVITAVAAIPRLPTAPPPGKDGSPEQAGTIQGLFFASPATDMAWYLTQAGPSNQAAEYNAALTTALTAYDGWLWATRNTTAMCTASSIGCARNPLPSACCKGDAAGTPRRGLLWSVGVSDSGEDSSTRFCKIANHTAPYAPCIESYAFPIQSGDVTSYSYDARASLARLARYRGDAEAAAGWEAKAAAVATNLKAQLWDTERSAVFAKDATDAVITTLVHDGLRVMWQGAFDQEMADAFVTTHIMNRSEFWTATPLPSISVSDPRYNALKNANSWSGRPMGLTFQRSIRALERYGHHAESVMVGERLTEAILAFSGCAGNASRCHFTLEIDPFTSIPMWAPWAPSDGYGPTLMAFLEHTALRVGVVPRPPDLSMGPLRKAATLFWTAVPNATAGATMAASAYTQTLGGATFALVIKPGKMTGLKNGVTAFTCTAGVRVVTTLDGAVVGLVGVSTVAVHAILTTTTTDALTGTTQRATAQQLVQPNAEWGRTASGFKLLRAAPYVPPFE